MGSEQRPDQQSEAGASKEFPNTRGEVIGAVNDIRAAFNESVRPLLEQFNNGKSLGEFTAYQQELLLKNGIFSGGVTNVMGKDIPLDETRERYDFDVVVPEHTFIYLQPVSGFLDGNMVLIKERKVLVKERIPADPLIWFVDKTPEANLALQPQRRITVDNSKPYLAVHPELRRTSVYDWREVLEAFLLSQNRFHMPKSQWDTFHEGRIAMAERRELIVPPAISTS